MIVRRVVAGDWRAVRELRLAGLAENRLNFAERLADAQAATDERWVAATEAQATSDTDFLAIAETADGVLVATTGGYVDADRPGRVTIYRVYVEPAWRGRGILEALVAAVRGWAASRPGIGGLSLLVHSGNGRAIAAYTRLGFVDQGVETPHPLDPEETEREMRMSLDVPA